MNWFDEGWGITLIGILLYKCFSVPLIFITVIRLSFGKFCQSLYPQINITFGFSSSDIFKKASKLFLNCSFVGEIRGPVVGYYTKL